MSYSQLLIPVGQIEDICEFSNKIKKRNSNKQHLRPEFPMTQSHLCHVPRQGNTTFDISRPLNDSLRIWHVTEDEVSLNT